jgi:fatty-acyl-CoA synthase
MSDVQAGLPGLMQQWPLTVDRILEYAARWHPHTEIVSRAADGAVSRTHYGEVAERARRFSAALIAAGIRPGERVATLALNGARHLEAWYGIMGIGAVCHTLNPRLPDDQLRYIANHAGDRWLLADPAFAPIVERLRPAVPSLERVIYLCAADGLPPGAPPGSDYEGLIADRPATARWGGFDENTAAGLCYTSGTTGHPKGVLYSHRSNVLHTLITQQASSAGLTATDVVLVVVPMFHANGWGMPFNAAAAGAKMVLPGPRLDGASLYELLETERVTVSAAVPTVWQLLLEHLTANALKLTTLKRVMIGGSACPEALMRAFEERHGVAVLHAWGMTETSPVGTAASPTAETAALGEAARRRLQLKQGRVPFGVEMKIVGEDGAELARDGERAGYLKVRGACVVQRYFAAERDVADADGWFDTGDIANIDRYGFMQITDRAKDLIKSGGEWISSVDIENAAAGHPKALMAAVIAMPHPKWRERPLLIVRLKPGLSATAEEFLEFLEGRIARWWMPDAVVFVDEMPLGATGKLDKKRLRERFPAAPDAQ